ncbi:(R)-1-hydroxy-2-trimethylaminoethylphosphonate oxygenase [Labrys neptuniae]
MTTPVLDTTTIVPFLAGIFERRGAEEYLGEPVTMAEHMLQGAWFAEQDGASDELVAAALLHDVGHFTSEFGAYSPDDTEDKHHDDAGAEVLAPFFPPVITECVRLHVAAKRYLCATDPSYDAKLSPASRHTLSLQGGPMNKAEIAQFRSSPFYKEAVRVRLWDEAGKVAGLKTRSFGDYAPLLQRVVDRFLVDAAAQANRAPSR